MNAANKVIGREPEMKKLDRMMQSGQAEFLAVYGRRRVGKTFLIRQYLAKNIVFDFSGTKDGSRQQQLTNFFDELTKRSKTRKKNEIPTTWHQAFKYLETYLSSLPSKKKVVVFIDEMPWLDTAKSGFIAALDFFWNQHISKMNHVLLIACGSASSWIRNKLINARGGLHNRITERIRLMPFNLHETELYINALGVTLPRYQILELYMAMGGIPFYLKEITNGKSATQLIDSICFSSSGLLHHEYNHLYHSLFKNADYHIAIIQALASRPQGMPRTDIAQRTKLSEGSLTRSLDELIECDFISLYQPFTNKKKQSIYKLTDLYSLFYLKFIKPNKNGGRGTWQSLSKQNTFTSWSGYAFENICMLHIHQIKGALGITGVYTKISSWLFRGNDIMQGAQIDMIIDRDDQAINLCDAKFTKENFTVTKKYAAQLRIQQAIFKQATQTTKSVFVTLITTYPTLKNKYYLEEIANEVTMDKLFEAE